MNAPAERAGGMSSPLRQMIGDEAGYLPVPIVTRRSSSRTSSRHDEAACVRELPDGACIVAGNAGDHPLVLQLLVETHHAAFADDFQTRLDEPNYRRPTGCCCVAIAIYWLTFMLPTISLGSRGNACPSLRSKTLLRCRSSATPDTKANCSTPPKRSRPAKAP
jgi:hypothetical protein